MTIKRTPTGYSWCISYRTSKYFDDFFRNVLKKLVNNKLNENAICVLSETNIDLPVIRDEYSTAEAYAFMTYEYHQKLVKIRSNENTICLRSESNIAIIEFLR